MWFWLLDFAKDRRKGVEHEHSMGISDLCDLILFYVWDDVQCVCVCV